MKQINAINYTVSDLLEINLSYMPFINNGGLFVPTNDAYMLGDCVTVNLSLPNKNEPIIFEGIVIWITPKNALHHVASGIGIQFSGKNAETIKTQIEALLDTTVDVGGYTYGITEEIRK